MAHDTDSQKISLPEWLSINPWAIVLVVTALIAGILMGAQHSKVPELANVIVGPAVGSFLAVGAGAWLANWQERRKRTEAKVFIAPILGEITQAIEGAINGYANYERLLQEHRLTKPAPKDGRVAAASCLAKLEEEGHKINRRLHQLQTAFNSVGYQGSVLYADALEILKRIQSRLDKHSEEMGETDADISERTVGDLIDLWRWSDSLKATAVSGKYTPSIRPLPDGVRNDHRWSASTPS
ncbi:MULTISPECIES: hypothetical protein [Gammaproteobacteria]|jgi:hypothetical protein|uniref:hypothetical protein n=1 Tax=Gammaproteobacteria TaxID=1236 RepID=UPI00066ECB97|nr:MULTISPECIES: hypothetical protein [Gammaproteobacteria]EKU9957101.1 hypothetical protein [Stenotrophomonas maltophilia]EKU9983357.1 hypothetical protein [Stenotrophomonas maltophilia]KUJ04647.1 hypothetical protein AR275_28560 [Stenotrophomonas maltophilia]KXU97331.1 hypothetical protein AB839_08065 [Stenotrophomonas sp. DDT-1]MBA0258588.1 hypothetical protein [Stenotrophomonas maltophilia]